MSPIRFKSMTTAPTDEDVSFLVLVPAKDERPECIVQVSRFQGMMFPDYLGVNVDFTDAIEDALGWCNFSIKEKKLLLA